MVALQFFAHKKIKVGDMHPLTVVVGTLILLPDMSHRQGGKDIDGHQTWHK
jgi:hypothetical protein